MLDSIAPPHPHPSSIVSRVVVVVLLLVSCVWSTPLAGVIVVNIPVTLACLSLELISSCVFDSGAVSVNCIHTHAFVCSR